MVVLCSLVEGLSAAMSVLRSPIFVQVEMTASPGLSSLHEHRDSDHDCYDYFFVIFRFLDIFSMHQIECLNLFNMCMTRGRCLRTRVQPSSQAKPTVAL